MSKRFPKHIKNEYILLKNFIKFKHNISSVIFYNFYKYDDSSLDFLQIQYKNNYTFLYNLNTKELLFTQISTTSYIDETLQDYTLEYLKYKRILKIKEIDVDGKL